MPRRHPPPLLNQKGLFCKSTSTFSMSARLCTRLTCWRSSDFGKVITFQRCPERQQGFQNFFSFLKGDMTICAGSIHCRLLEKSCLLISLSLLFG